MSTPLDEFERIEVLRRIFGTPSKNVTLGIGDDAAVVCGDLAWSIDEAVEGTHFRSTTSTYSQIGYRATMAALSDLAAMGAEPLGVLCAIALPVSLDEAALFQLAEGQKRAADDAGTFVIGGNLARSPVLSLTTSVLGRGSPLLTRAGARPGDVLWIAGQVGLASCGFVASERGVTSHALAASAFATPRALLQEGKSAACAGATAMIDVSDGLLADVQHLARASEVRCWLEVDALISAELASAASELGIDPLACALHGGEDYALVAAAPAGVSLLGFRRLGRCEAKTGEHGQVDLDGEARIPNGRGFDHFR